MIYLYIVFWSRYTGPKIHSWELSVIRRNWKTRNANWRNKKLTTECLWVCETFRAFLQSVQEIPVQCQMVKQSLYKPRQSLRVPWNWGSQNVRQSAAFARVGNIPVESEGLCQCKIPKTPSGVETATFRLVAHCLNQLRQRVPPCQCSTSN